MLSMPLIVKSRCHNNLLIVQYYRKWVCQFLIEFSGKSMLSMPLIVKSRCHNNLLIVQYYRKWVYQFLIEFSGKSMLSMPSIVKSRCHNTLLINASNKISLGCSVTIWSCLNRSIISSSVLTVNTLVLLPSILMSNR